MQKVPLALTLLTKILKNMACKTTVTQGISAAKIQVHGIIFLLISTLGVMAKIATAMLLILRALYLMAMVVRRILSTMSLALEAPREL